MKRIKNKIINKIVAELLVKHVDEYEYDYVKDYGFTMDELKRWIGIVFANLLYAIYHNHPFLEWLLCSLCEAEMQLKLVADEDFKFDLDTADVCCGDKSDAMMNIPENTLYCSGCPYRDTSELAKIIFGYQLSGYCYYLGKGDFSFCRPTELLWDGCKECGINNEIEIEEDEE